MKTRSSKKEKRLITEVELQLQVLRGEVDQWQVLVPRGAAFELREPAAQDERIDRRTLPTEEAPALTSALTKIEGGLGEQTLAQLAKRVAVGGGGHAARALRVSRRNPEAHRISTRWRLRSRQRRLLF